MTKTTRFWGRLLAPAAVFVAVTGCDFEVTNPGPTADEFLDSLNAHQAIVTGARADLGDAMENITYWGAAMAYEMNPAGSTGSFGIPTYIQDGRFDAFDSGDWNQAARARWVADDALRRFEEVLPQIDGAPAVDQYEPTAWAALWSGYANRLLGDNFCTVTYDGGPEEPHTAAFVRAEAAFTRAITVATNVGNTEIATAARAGRASVRAYLATYGQASWADAVSDASGIADDFVFAMPYSTQDQDQFNRIHFANGNEPYRAHTQWGTFYQEWFDSTDDPRAEWGFDPAVPTGDAAVSKFGGQVPWYFQEKFDQRDSPINLSSGWEMRLIQAEAALVSGDFAAANTLMNRRIDALNTAGANIPQAAATSVAEGYAKLYTERALELLFEGRRMGDIRRWIDNATPGAPQTAGTAGAFIDGVYFDQGATGAVNNTGTPDVQVEFVIDRHRAYPIGNAERLTNTNLSSTANFCTS